MGIERIGIVGAGEMGKGIAQVFALAGYQVLLQDTAEDAIDTALEKIRGNLKRQAKRSRIAPEAVEESMARITRVNTLAEVAQVDLLIEAVTENETIKAGVFRELLPHLPDPCLLASNTSSISITRLASGTDRPNKFMGVHFMNPVPVMKLVELIRGIATDDSTYETLVKVTKSLGKTPAPSADFPGFVVNRLLMPMINEAIYALYEGVGSVESIDSSMRLGANHPMGPFELADFIGLDACLAIMNALYEGFAARKYRPCPLLTKYVEAGWLGRRTGRGFYDYRGEVPVPTR